MRWPYIYKIKVHFNSLCKRVSVMLLVSRPPRPDCCDGGPAEANGEHAVPYLPGDGDSRRRDFDEMSNVQRLPGDFMSNGSIHGVDAQSRLD